MNFEKLVDEIVSVSNTIRFVLVIDEKGNAIHSKIVTKSFLIKNNQAMVLSTDMVVLKRLYPV